MLTSEEESDCVDCTWVDLDIAVDSYPDETSWDVAKVDTVEDNNQLIMDGNTCTRSTAQNDRKKKSSREKKSTQMSRLLDDITINKQICLENNDSTYVLCD